MFKSICEPIDVGQVQRTLDPFHNEPIVHLGFHLYPIPGECFNWHIQKLNELIPTINGQVIIGLATTPETWPLNKVRSLLPGRCEVFEFPNTSEGENQTFRELQQRIPQGNDDVLLYCHGKGVSKQEHHREAVRLWTEFLYESVAFNVAELTAKMSQGYQLCGSLMTDTDHPMKPANGWHFSGTFFVVRAKYLADKPVTPQYGGVESWPGDHFNAADAYSSFIDNLGPDVGYDINRLYPEIVNAQMDWEAARIGGPRCEQHLRELNWFVRQTKACDNVLVIGSRHGGLERVLRDNWNCETVSIDIVREPENLTDNLIVGNSADQYIQTQARDFGPFDIVFIDGDHSYQGVESDWRFAQSLNPRLIAFHDIADAIKHRREGCDVPKLWSEIKKTHTTSEMIVGCGWGGIGIVHW